MAKIGLRNFLYGKLTEQADGTAVYGKAKKPAKAISATVDITSNDASLYADDALAESDKTFQSAAVTLGIDDDNAEVMADLLGHTYSDGETVRGAYDTAPYVGLGRIVTKIVNGVYKYKVEFLKKVKFSEPSQEDNTKGESVEFGTTEIEGTASTLADGTWSVSKTFDTMDDAQTYLASFFEQPATFTVTYNVNGGTGTVAPATVTEGQSITLDDGSGITPPSDKAFIGWATTDSAVTPNATSPYTPAGDVTLYAVYADVYTVTYDENGGTGTVDPVDVIAGESITLDDGSTRTPPAGKIFAGWATTDSAVVADVTSPYTPVADITIYAVWDNE